MNSPIEKTCGNDQQLSFDARNRCLWRAGCRCSWLLVWLRPSFSRSQSDQSSLSLHSSRPASLVWIRPFSPNSTFSIPLSRLLCLLPRFLLQCCVAFANIFSFYWNSLLVCPGFASTKMPLVCPFVLAFSFWLLGSTTAADSPLSLSGPIPGWLCLWQVWSLGFWSRLYLHSEEQVCMK